MIYIIISAAVFILITAYYWMFNKKPGIIFLLFCFLSFIFYYFYRDFSLPVFIAYAALFVFFSITSLEDIKNHSISVVHVLLLIVPVIIARYFLDIPPLNTVISVSFGFLTLFIPCIITKESQIGLGDAFILGIISALLEPFGVFAVLLLASFTGLVYALIYWRMKGQKPAVPYLPFLEGALFIYLPLQPVIMGWIIG